VFFVFFVFFVVQSFLSLSAQPHFAIDDFDCDARERISFRRTGETAPGFDVKTRAVRCANYLAGLEKKPARRPIQTAAGMRTFVVISEHVRTLAQQDQRKYAVVEFGIDGCRATVGNRVELA
jgi:hypothetical protein